MSTIEVLKNVYVDDSVTQLFDNPIKWIEGRENFIVRTVGGIHNLSHHDKEAWAKNEGNPIRMVELETGREEIWFPSIMSGAPSYISLNVDGEIQSHVKYSRIMPAVSLDNFNMSVKMWYENGVISRDDQNPSLEANRLMLSIQDEDLKDFVTAIIFKKFSETWEDGKWKRTETYDMEFVFSDSALNRPKIKEKATKWISDHCKGGFFPLSKNLFREKDEEFMFISDFSS